MGERGLDPRLAALVHDLRGSLVVVEGFATLLARDAGALSAEQRGDYARRVVAAAGELRERLDAEERAAAG